MAAQSGLAQDASYDTILYDRRD